MYIYAYSSSYLQKQFKPSLVLSQSQAEAFLVGNLVNVTAWFLISQEAEVLYEYYVVSHCSWWHYQVTDGWGMGVQCHELSSPSVVYWREWRDLTWCPLREFRDNQPCNVLFFSIRKLGAVLLFFLLSLSFFSPETRGYRWTGGCAYSQKL